MYNYLLILFFTYVIDACAMEKNVNLTEGIELPECSSSLSTINKEQLLSLVATMNCDNDDICVATQQKCHCYENSSQNWFAIINSNYHAKKKLYKRSLDTLPPCVANHITYINKFLIEGPNPAGITVTTVESGGIHCINAFYENNRNDFAAIYNGSVLSLALSSDNILAISGPHQEGFYFSLYKIATEVHKEFFSKERIRPKLIKLAIKSHPNLGLLFKKMTFIKPNLLWCIDLKNKLRAVYFDKEHRVITHNDWIVLPEGKKQRVKFFSSDPANRQYTLLVDSADDIYAGVITQKEYALKKIRTVQSLINQIKTKKYLQYPNLTDVRLANKKCFFTFTQVDEKTEVSFKFDLSFNGKAIKSNIADECFVLLLKNFDE